MITAEWLLKNRQKHISLAKLLEVQIQHTIATLTQATDADDFIEGMVLGVKPMDSKPHVPGCGSKTEDIAIHYRERMEAEKKCHVQMLEMQLNQTQYYIHLYDAIMEGLDPNEKWIVDSHYLQSLSLTEMVRIAPDTLSNTSKSTLCRKKKELLIKIDHYLQIVQAPSGRISANTWRPVRTTKLQMLKGIGSPNLMTELDLQQNY